MYKIEEKSSIQECIVQAIHIVTDVHARRRLVEEAGALPHHHSDRGYRAFINEMRIMFGRPLEEFARRLQYPAVLSQTLFGSNNVLIRNHPRSEEHTSELQ